MSIFNSITGGSGSGTLLTTTFTGSNSSGINFTTTARAKAFFICITSASNIPSTYFQGSGVITSVSYTGSNCTAVALKQSSNKFITSSGSITPAITDSTVSISVGNIGATASGATYTVYYLV